MWAQGCVANMAVLMRLLLAEDDLGLRGVLQRGLSEEGYVVDAVPTGNEALEICVLTSSPSASWTGGCRVLQAST